MNKFIALTGALTLFGLFIGRADEPKKADENKVQLMFGGVGVGFHGAGAGARGVGLRR